MLKVAFIVPAIRTHLWKRFLDSIDYSGEWEVIFASPFKLPSEISDYNEQIKHVQTYDTVPVAMQKATLLADSDLVLHAVDDSVFLPNMLDKAIQFYEDNCNLQDAVGLTYIENTNNMTPIEKWTVRNLPEFHLPYIRRDWVTFVQPIMRLDWFIDLGGFDCRYRYSNHAHHCLAFRLQQAGGSVYVPPFTVSHAGHMPERTGDHGPVHDVQTQIDDPAFRELWSNPRDSFIDYEAYRQFEGTWQDRFSRHYTSYAELCEGEGYDV